MADLSQYVPNLALVLVLYCIAEILKVTVLKSDSQKKILPVVCGLFGALISVGVFMVQPGLLNCSDILSAIICGIISGFAATGANQVYKQIKKDTMSINQDD